MRFNTVFFYASTLLGAATSSLAAPISSQQQIVVSPHITSPEANDFWPQGSRQVVRWDTDKVPRDSVIAKGMVLLGYWSPDSESEHLDFEHPLATGFSLAEGSVEIVIPVDVESRRSYFIVLFGDSGNVSPSFTIDQVNGVEYHSNISH